MIECKDFCTNLFKSWIWLSEIPPEKKGVMVLRIFSKIPEWSCLETRDFEILMLLLWLLWLLLLLCLLFEWMSIAPSKNPSIVLASGSLGVKWTLLFLRICSGSPSWMLMLLWLAAFPLCNPYKSKSFEESWFINISCLCIGGDFEALEKWIWSSYVSMVKRYMRSLDFTVGSRMVSEPSTLMWKSL